MCDVAERCRQTAWLSVYGLFLGGGRDILRQIPHISDRVPLPSKLPNDAWKLVRVSRPVY